MDYVVARSTAPPIEIAAIHDQATMDDLVSKIERHIESVIQDLQKAGIKFGRAAVIYWDHEEEKSLIESADGVEIDVGWEVEALFDDRKAGIFSVRTPAGASASTTHIGPYNELHKAHSAVRQWCKQHDVRRLGPNWEVYDHPREGQPLRTDVFYLVK